MKEFILAGVLGHCVGDALGVPVENFSRAALQEHPVVSMQGFGSHNQPAGTWSDDSSLTLCLLEALTRTGRGEPDFRQVLKNSVDWLNKGRFTPAGEAFGAGKGTRRALERFQSGTDPLLCGGEEERDNGNGSLMRILPLVFVLFARYGAEIFAHEQAVRLIHQLSGLTHRHPRSLIGCGIFCAVACRLLGGEPCSEAVNNGVAEARKWYAQHPLFCNEFSAYARLGHPAFHDHPEEAIVSSGYVVHTLEAALWCLLTTHDYASCVLRAVNLGGDTDTTAAVAGGLAGLRYGQAAIPSVWLDVLAHREWIAELCNEMAEALSEEGPQWLLSLGKEEGSAERNADEVFFPNDPFQKASGTNKPCQKASCEKEQEQTISTPLSGEAVYQLATILSDLNALVTLKENLYVRTLNMLEREHLLVPEPLAILARYHLSEEEIRTLPESLLEGADEALLRALVTWHIRSAPCSERSENGFDTGTIPALLKALLEKRRVSPEGRL